MTLWIVYALITRICVNIVVNCLGLKVRVRVWVRVSVFQRCIRTIVNTIINLEYGWRVRGCCKQWQKLAKQYPVIELA